MTRAERALDCCGYDVAFRNPDTGKILAEWSKDGEGRARVLFHIVAANAGLAGDISEWIIDGREVEG